MKKQWIITVPEGMEIDSIADSVGVTEVESVGTGCGSDEYMLNSYRDAQKLVKALKQEALRSIAIVGSEP